MMPLDAMYLRPTGPRSLDLTALNTWPPAPGIPALGPVKCGQLDDEHRRIDTITIRGRDDAEFRRKLAEYARVHGTILVAFVRDGHSESVAAVWT